MENNLFKHSANRLEAHLGKDAHKFTKEDIKQVVSDLNIRMVNFMYPAGDGRLKTLNFMLHTPEYLETILTNGERVDGSSLFSFIAAASSDLYVMPSLIRSLRFLRSVCSVRSSTVTAIRWHLPRNIRFTRPWLPSGR